MNRITQYGNVLSYATGTLRFYLAPSGLQTTGIYGLVGQEIAVYVDAAVGEPLPKLVLCQSHGLYSNYRREVTLQRGINRFITSVTSSSGDNGCAFYFSNLNTPENQGDVSVYVEGGEFYPIFAQGDDEEVFIEELIEYEARRANDRSLPDFAELQSERLLITLQSSTSARTDARWQIWAIIPSCNPQPNPKNPTTATTAVVMGQR